MTRRIAGLPVWSPGDVIDGMRALVGWTDEAVVLVGGLPERVAALLDDVDVLLARVSATVDRVDTVVGRAEGLVDTIDGTVGRIGPLLAQVEGVAGEAEGVVARAGAVAERADGVVVRAGGVSDDAAAVIEQATAVAHRAGEVVAHASDASGAAHDLLDTYAPIAEKAAPLARQFVTEFSEEELHALIRLVDHMPALTEHMESDILPILATLDRVGPDVHELLDVLKEVRQAINGIPGFGYFRRRGSDGGG